MFPLSIFFAGQDVSFLTFYVSLLTLYRKNWQIQPENLTKREKISSFYWSKSMNQLYKRTAARKNSPSFVRHPLLFAATYNFHHFTNPLPICVPLANLLVPPHCNLFPLPVMCQVIPCQLHQLLYAFKSSLCLK